MRNTRNRLLLPLLEVVNQISELKTKQKLADPLSTEETSIEINLSDRAEILGKERGLEAIFSEKKVEWST